MDRSKKRPSCQPVLVIVSLAGLVWGGCTSESDRLDRTIELAEAGSADASTWYHLAERAADPRVSPLFRRLLADLAALDFPQTSTARSRTLRNLGPLKRAFEVAPPTVDEALTRDLTELYLKFVLPKRHWDQERMGFPAPYEMSLFELLIPDFDKESRVTDTMLDYLVELSRTAVQWESGTHEFFSSIALEIDRRERADDQRFIDSLARAQLLAFWLKEAPIDHLRTLSPGPKGAGAWQSAFVEAWKQERVLKPPVFSQAANELLRHGIDAETEFVSALIFQCATGGERRIDDCVELGRALGTGAPARIRAQAAELGTPEAQASAEEFARLVSNAPQPTSAVSILAAVARSLPDPKRSGRQISPAISSPPTSDRVDRAYTALVAMGDLALPALWKGFIGDNRAVSSLSARVLSRNDTRRFAQELGPLTEALAPLAHLGSEAADGDELEKRRPYWQASTPVMYGLRALATVNWEDDFILVPFFRALSLKDPRFSEFATEVLKRQLDKDAFADALFRYLAKRESFGIDEVAHYQNALLSYRGISPAIERNLSNLLEAGQGHPEKVFWIHKLVGLQSLERAGASSALPLLELYARDSGSYDVQYTDGRMETFKFAALANKAMAAIRQR